MDSLFNVMHNDSNTSTQRETLASVNPQDGTLGSCARRESNIEHVRDTNFTTSYTLPPSSKPAQTSQKWLGRSSKMRREVGRVRSNPKLLSNSSVDRIKEGPNQKEESKDVRTSGRSGPMHSVQSIFPTFDGVRRSVPVGASRGRPGAP